MRSKAKARRAHAEGGKYTYVTKIKYQFKLVNFRRCFLQPETFPIQVVCTGFQRWLRELVCTIENSLRSLHVAYVLNSMHTSLNSTSEDLIL